MGTAPGAPTATLSAVDPTCSTATGTITVTSATAGLEFAIDGGAYATYPAGGFSGLASGAHTIKVKNAAGCETTLNQPEGTAPGAPTATLSAVDPTCSTATGTITVTSATTGLEFAIDGGAYATYPAGGFSGLSSGAHTIKVKNAAGCETTLNQPEGTAPGAPTATLSAVDPTCSTATGTITVTSATTGLEFAIDGGAYATYPAGGFSGLSSGAHTIKVKNAAGCETTLNQPEGTAPGAPTATLSAVDPTCSTATGTITVTSATTGLEFAIDGGAYATYPAGGFSGLSSGAHTIKVKNAAGCETTLNQPVGTAPGAPTATLSAVDPTCSTSTGTITVTSATAGLEFAIDGGAYATYPAGGFSGLSSGAHTIKVKNASGCETTLNQPVGTAPGAPTATLSAVDPTCSTATGTITVTSATAGLEFAVDGGAYAAYPAGGFSGLSSGAHTIKVKNAAGCETTLNQPVGTAPGAPTATLSAVDPTCSTATGTITVTSATAGLEFAVDGGAYASYPAGGFSGLSSGAHTIKVKNAAGCETTLNQPEGTAPGAPTATLSAVDPTCSTATGTITVTSATTGLEFAIDGGAYATYPAGGFSGLSSGAHTIKVKNAAGCETTLNQPEGTAPGAPTATLSAVDPTCSTATGTITVTSATTGLEFAIDGGAYATYPAGGFSGLSSGAHTIKVKNAAGCETTLNQPVGTAPGAPTATLSAVDPTCSTSTGTITVTSATAGLEFAIDGGAYATYPAGGFSGLSSGAHTIKVKNASGCETTLNQPVGTAPGAPTATLSAVDPTCSTATGTITVTSATAGLEFAVDGGAYAAYPAGGFSGLSSGAHTIKVKNAAGCETTLNQPVGTAPGAPTATLSAVDPTCSTATGTITVTSATAGLEFAVDGGAYASYPAGGFSGLSSGAHTIKVKNAAGCETTLNQPEGTAPGAPTATLSAVDPTCSTATGTITVTSATTGLEFAIDGGAYATYPAGGFSGLSSGAHTIKVKNAAGCETTLNQPVGTAPGAPTATLSAVDPTCSTSTGTITVTSATAGLEFAIDGGAYATYPAGGFSGLSSGAHTIKVKNASGCETTLNQPVGTAPGAPTATLSAVDPTCSTATGTITVTSATAGLEFAVDGGAYASYPAGGFSGLSSGAHTIKVKNAAGCETTLNQPEGTAPGAPTATLSAVDPTCSTATGTITVTSATTGLEFAIDGGAYATYPAGGFSGLSSGAHTIKVKNAAGCETTLNQPEGTAPGAPTATLSAVDPTCSTATGTITVTSATTGLEFAIDGGAYATYPAGGFSGLSSGAHTIKVKNAAGCETTLNQPVGTAPGAPTATLSAVDPTCSTATGTITVTSATAGLEFAIDGGAYATYPAGGFSGLASGSHTIKVKNASGCETTLNQPVGTAPGAPTATLSAVDPTCSTATGTITVTSATTGLEFAMDGGAYASYPAGGFSGLSSGAHTIKVKNAAGCETTLNQPVGTAPGAPTATLSAVDPTCSTATGTITVTSATAGLEFAVDGGAYASYPAGGFSGLSSGAHTIKVK